MSRSVITVPNAPSPTTPRNRHCPKCQSTARDRWLAERAQELLPVPYCHVVFTVPQELAPLALQNQRWFYRLLFRAVSQTLLEIAADPRHLGARIGFLAVLHTWGQNLLHHPHLHCVVPAEEWRSMVLAGLLVGESSSCQFAFSAVCFAESFSPFSRKRIPRKSSTSLDG